MATPPLPWSFSNSDELMVRQVGHGQSIPLFYCLRWSEAMFWSLPRKRHAAGMSALSLPFILWHSSRQQTIFFYRSFSLCSYFSVYQLIILCNFMTMFSGLCQFFFYFITLKLVILTDFFPLDFVCFAVFFFLNQMLSTMNLAVSADWHSFFKEKKCCPLFWWELNLS